MYLFDSQLFQHVNKLMNIWSALLILLPACLDYLPQLCILDPVHIQPTVILNRIHNHDFIHILLRNAATRYFPEHGA